MALDAFPMLFHFVEALATTMTSAEREAQEYEDTQGSYPNVFILLTDAWGIIVTSIILYVACIVSTNHSCCNIYSFF